MPTLLFCPVQAADPVANKDLSEDKVPSHEVAVSLASSVPEMYRRTMSAMIDGHKISPLLPLPHIACCLNAAVDTSTELSKVEEAEERSEEEIEKNSDAGAEKLCNESIDNDTSAAWVFKPSVATWLVPLPTHAEDELDNVSKNLESSVPTVSEPKAVKVTKVQRKGLGARIKSWFCCAQASAAQPKPVKAGTKPVKAAKKAKTVKSKP
jgi:hypothetical protein